MKPEAHVFSKWQMLIAIASLIAIAMHFILNDTQLIYDLRLSDIPLLALIIIGGIPLVIQVAAKLFRGSVGADFLGGIELVAAAALEQYLASALIVLMLAGGQALEVYAMRKASAVLRALSERMPSSAHRKKGDGVEEITLADIAIGDEILVYPH
jgi:cation transport ATPase